MKESIEKAKKSGMDGYLLKPIGKKELYDEVESKLKEYRKNILN
jgi:AmiR/NasT family two-component response regulator